MGSSMWQQPATQDQLLRVMLACDEFRRYWSKFRAMPFAPSFEGEMDDLAAINYLEYEGLGFPKGDLEMVALVWGQVLARQLGLDWVSSPFGDLMLGQLSIDPVFDVAVSIWPYARVLELECGGSPQFGRFSWLTRRTIAGCLEQGYNSDLEAKLLRLRAELGGH